MAAYSSGGAPALLTVSGVGPRRAAAAAKAVLEAHNPGAVVSLGFAGGLVEGQRPGDLIVATTLAPVSISGREQSAFSRAVDADAAMLAEALSVASKLGLRCRAGAMLTADRVVSGPEEKRRLGAETGALAVEMESYWIGLACRERDVPFLTVRAVADTVERPLPGSVARLALGPGLHNGWRPGISVALHPWWAPGLVRLAQDAAAAQGTLTSFALGYLAARAGAPAS